MKIIIAGGTGGIGKILVSHLVASHEVIILCQSEKSKEKLLSTFKKGINCNIVDITDHNAVDSFFSSQKSCDVLINCAGILGPVSNLEDSDIELWSKTVAVNLMGTVNCCKAAVSLLKLKKHTKIINVSGGGSAFPRIYHSAYASSKAAVVRFTECLAKDFEHDNVIIDVNVIAPGAHKTNMWNSEKFDEEPKEWSDPKLLVELIDFLISKKSDGISGKFFSIKDDYKNPNKSINNSDLFTLRRIDNFKFKSIDT